MTILTWGKPLIEIVESNAGAIPAVPVWVSVGTIAEKTAQLITEKGEVKTAKDEGGQIVDQKNLPNNYKLEFDLFIKSGMTKPVVDVDGVVANRYCIRLTPENDLLAGYLMEETAVSCEESWSSDKGSMMKYTFTGLVPAVGAILKPYTKAP